MVFAASVVYFNENRAEEVKNLISSFQNIEIYDSDMKKGKMVIVIEADNTAVVEDTENAIRQNDAIEDVAHYAFHFGEEVDGLLDGSIKPDINFEEIFKKKRRQNEHI